MKRYLITIAVSWLTGLASLLAQQPAGIADATAMIPRLDSLGRHYLEVGQLDSSAHFFREGLRLRKVAEVKADQELVRSFMKLFFAANDPNKGGAAFFKRAKDLLVAYPYLAKEAAENDTLYFAGALTVTSGLLIQIEEFDTAEKFVETAVNLTRSEASSSSKAQLIYFAGLGSWANILLSKNEYANVEKIYLERLDSMRSFGWDTTLNATIFYSNALNDLGWLYNQSDRYAEAIPPLKQSVLLKRNAGIATREQKEALITILGNLGSALVEHSDYEEAEQVYQERVQLQKEINGDTSYPYAEAINDLGWAYDRMGRHFEAIGLLEKSLELKKDHLRLESRDDYQSCQGLPAHDQIRRSIEITYSYKAG